MKFGRNFIPTYNAQAVTTEDQIIVAAEITTTGGDFEELDPMIAATAPTPAIRKSYAQGSMPGMPCSRNVPRRTESAESLSESPTAPSREKQKCLARSCQRRGR